MTYSNLARALSTLAAALATASIGAALLAGAAQANHACSPPTKYPGGNGYFTSLEVHNTNCATGDKVVFAWYHCRTKNGVSGHCNMHVVGFACTEKRVTIPTEFNARVTCHKGSATVIHTYQQNT
ncbi:MAG: hypothetical protein M3071_24285 [Actinomycetota bacterium]|nr:hypothetical protein [Actinomycetota bacterium]